MNLSPLQDVLRLGGHAREGLIPNLGLIYLGPADVIDRHRPQRPLLLSGLQQAKRLTLSLGQGLEPRIGLNPDRTKAC